MAVTFGCSIPSSGALASPENLRALAQRAEDLGFDSVWVSDHVVVPRQIESFYPYAPDGVPTFRPDLPYFEPLAALNFLAGCTQRVRLGTHVLIIPYRNPVVTAKMLATLDVLSGGRVILGAGVGWMEEEFLALGLDTYHQRGAVTDEYIRLFKELWTKDEPEFHGSTTRCRERVLSPSRCRNPTCPSGSAATPGPPYAALPSWVTAGYPLDCGPRPYWSLKRWRSRSPGYAPLPFAPAAPRMQWPCVSAPVSPSRKHRGHRDKWSPAVLSR